MDGINVSLGRSLRSSVSPSMQLLTPAIPTSLVLLIRRILNVFSTLTIATAANGRLLSTEGTAKADGGAMGSKLDDKDGTKSKGDSTSKPSSNSSRKGSKDDNSPINLMLRNPALYSPLRKPRLPIALCHGLYGFDVRGPSSFPSLQLHYWNSVMDILRDKIDAKVVVCGVSGTASIIERATQMDRYLQEKLPGREINFIGHSMGGLDARHLISSMKPSMRSYSPNAPSKPYHPKSLTTLATPHRGSPFMDWCMANIGIGAPRPDSMSDPKTRLDASTGGRSKGGVDASKTTPESAADYKSDRADGATSSQEGEDALNPPSTTSSGPSWQSSTKKFLKKLPYSLSSPIFTPPSDNANYPLSPLSPQSYFSLPTLLLSLIDSPAYSNLTTYFLKEFNERTRDDPCVKYMSVAARKDRSNFGVWHPLWFPKVVVDGVEDHERAEATSSHSPNPSSPSTPYHSDPSSYRSSSSPSPTATWADLEPYSIHGNDGLVPVSSARWGEFLGVVDNCDHWEIRGAGGLRNLNLNLNFNLGNLTGWGSGFGEAMSWMEWRKAKAKDDAEKAVESVKKELGKNVKDEKEERDVKALTDRLSAVVDWLVDRPAGSSPPNPPSTSIISGERRNGRAAAAEEKKKVEEKKLDLERFYVALCRKLYDEGL